MKLKINKMKNKKFSIIIVLFFAIYSNLFSQADSIKMQSQELAKNLIHELQMKHKFGVYGNFGYNMYLADFKKLPGVSCCSPNFSFGSGTGFTFGGLYEIPITNEWHLNFRFGYTEYDGYFSVLEETVGIIDGESAPVKFEHYLEASLPSLFFEPLVGYQYLENLFFHGGLRFGFALSPKYEQFEQIIEPTTRGTFSNGSRINNASSGDIPDAFVIQAGLNLGISYLLPMDSRRSFFLAPEIFYTFNVTPVVSGETWFTHQLRGGISIKYRKPLPPPPAPLAPPSQPLNDFPLPDSPPQIFADIKAIEIDSNDVENPNFNIRIEDFVTLNMRPLLNYVFFEENSHEIPDRYIKLEKFSAQDFKLKQMQDLNAMQTYYNVLNIVGKRLQDNPDVKITLIGTNSDNGIEKGNLELSRKRAESVKNYFKKTWGINEDRISIEARNKPKQPTRDDEPGGDEENRRVEILSDGLILTDPVITNDTMRVLSISKIKFIPEIDSERKLSKWNIQAQQNNKVLISFEGKGEIPNSLIWNMSDDNSVVPTTAGNIFYWIEIENDLGQIAVSQKKKLPVEQLTIDKKRMESIQDKEFEYYSLILFDFGTTNLGTEHKEVVDFVKGRITPEAIVTIRGYTDALGDEGVNKRISQKRADAVAKRIKIPGAIVEGSGENPLLFDNKLPEGRFYCRTVQILIETPVK